MLSSNIPSASRASLTLCTTLPLISSSPSRTLLLRCGTRQQMRSFRFGLWSSYLDPEYEKEMRRLQRKMNHKHSEVTNRKLSWDRHFPASPKHMRFKNFMCSAWRSQDPRPGGRWVNIDELHTPKERPSNSQQSAAGGAGEDKIDEYSRELFRVFWSMKTREAKKESHQPGPVPVKFSSTSKVHTKEEPRNESKIEPEYVIDPITNKKVFINKTADTPKSQKQTEIPVKTFKGYRSQFQNVQPPTSSSPDTTPESRPSSRLHPAQAVKQEQSSNQQPLQNSEGTPDIVTNTTEASSHNEVPEYLQKFEQEHPYGKRRYREPEDETNEESTLTQDGLGAYDQKVQFYRDGLVYDPSKCAIDYSDPDQKGLKAFDEKKSEKCRETSKGECVLPEDASNAYLKSPTDQSGKLRSHDENEVENINVKSDPVLRSIQEYEATVSHPLAKTIHDCQINAQRADLTSFRLDYPPDSTREALKKIDAERDSLGLRSKKAVGQEEMFGSAPTSLPNRIKRFFEYGTSQDANSSASSAERMQDLDLLRPSDVRAASGLRKRRNHHRGETDAEKHAVRQKLEADFEKYENEVEVLHKEGNKAALPKEEDKPRSKAEITGNYVRDFPEEFQAAWAPDGDTGSLVRKSSIYQETEAAAQTHPKRYIDELTSKERSSQNSETPRIETALDRCAAQKARESIESDPHKDLTQKIRDIYEDSYGSIDHNHRQIPQTVNANKKAVNESSKPPEPTLYKILAYDPTMQSISTAETTSIVADSSSPLTPAEVLLRLSNPTKFFPHFKPLQAQGYEIISGSGDVLVFRKVRPADNSNSSTVSEQKKTQTRDPMLRNPIDGMGPIAPTGNFASPTGFVNYDLNRGTEPPFKSNIDVRREEPVFSGKRNWKDEKEVGPGKKGRAKKVLVGAAWVAACSYAIGVVADYFMTGGIDGKGPQGF